MSAQHGTKCAFADVIWPASLTFLQCDQFNSKGRNDDEKNSIKCLWTKNFKLSQVSSRFWNFDLNFSAYYLNTYQFTPMSMMIVLFVSPLKTPISFNVRNMVYHVIFSFSGFLACVVRKTFSKLTIYFLRSKRFNFQWRSSLPFIKCVLHYCSALLFSNDLFKFFRFIISIKSKTGELIRAMLGHLMKKSLRSWTTADFVHVQLFDLFLVLLFLFRLLKSSIGDACVPTIRIFNCTILYIDS